MKNVINNLNLPSITNKIVLIHTIMNNFELPELNQRLKDIIDYFCKGNIAEFSRSLDNVSQQRLDRLFKIDKRNNKYPTVPVEIAQSVIKRYPVNIDWLMNGKGEMLKETIKDRLISFLAYLNIGQGAFEKNVGISNGYINNIKSSVKLDL